MALPAAERYGEKHWPENTVMHGETHPLNPEGKPKVVSIETADVNKKLCAFSSHGDYPRVNGMCNRGVNFAINVLPLCLSTCGTDGHAVCDVNADCREGLTTHTCHCRAGFTGNGK
jgi:hypothetical protein